MREKIYAVAIDSFCNGQSVRGAYTIADGPYEEETAAIQKIDTVVNSLKDSYKSLENENRTISVKNINEKTKVLMLDTDTTSKPLIRCSVLDVDMSAVTSVKTGGIDGGNGGRKRGTAEQTQKRKQKIKMNQYVASLTPAALI